MRLENKNELNMHSKRIRMPNINYRGSFAACCRNRKGNKIKSIMRHMLVKSKWCTPLHCKELNNIIKETNHLSWMGNRWHIMCAYLGIVTTQKKKKRLHNRYFLFLFFNKLRKSIDVTELTYFCIYYFAYFSCAGFRK